MVVCFPFFIALHFIDIKHILSQQLYYKTYKTFILNSILYNSPLSWLTEEAAEVAEIEEVAGIEEVAEIVEVAAAEVEALKMDGAEAGADLHLKGEVVVEEAAEVGIAEAFSPASVE